MDSSKALSLLESLDDSIEDLREALSPILNDHLATTASKLPLIDKAQLHVLWAYAIESILFSYLRLNGVDAKDHAVFRELNRVKQYFAKVKASESANDKPTLNLDKAAAGRFIKHALAANNNRLSDSDSKVVISASNTDNEGHTKRRKTSGDAEAQSRAHSSSTRKAMKSS